jgi:hypothetical protein
MMAFKTLQNIYVELPEDNAMPEASTQQTLPGGKLLVGCPSQFMLHHLSYIAELIGTPDAVVE